MNTAFFKSIVIFALTFGLSSASYGAVINVINRSLELKTSTAVPVQINYRSETVVTPGSAAANIYAEAIQIKVESCSTSPVTARLRGITNAGADIIQILNLNKMSQCTWVATPVYSLAIANLNSGQVTINEQVLEIGIGNLTEKFDLRLGN